MYDLKQLFSALFETFDKSSVAVLRSHMRAFPLAKRWNICADYCLGDPDRVNDVFAFTFIPGIQAFEDLSASIDASVPADLKKTKRVEPATLAFLRKQSLFHLAFIFDEKAQVFDNGPDGPPPAEVAREFSDYLARMFRAQGRGEEAIRRFDALARDAQRKTFNRKLLQRLYLLSVFFAFCSLVVARERKVTHSWFSDEDRMTTGFGGLVWDLALETLYGVGRARGIRVQTSPAICVPTPIEELRGLHETVSLHERKPLDRPYMWFDQLVRLPDHVAGVLSAYDLRAADVRGGAEKHQTLTTDFLAETRNLVVIRVKMRDGLQFSRITFHKAQGGDLRAVDEAGLTD